MKKNLIITIFTFLITFMGSSGLSAQEDDSLVSAYQREFVYLDNEIRLLEKRLEEVNIQGTGRVEEANLLLEEVELKLLTIQDELSRRSEELNILESEKNSSADGYDTLISIITQGTSRLQKFNKTSFKEKYIDEYESMDEKERLGKELAYVFEENLNLLAESGSIRVEEGSFFLPSGKQERGDITYIGQISALGSGDETGGTLAPAGGGRFHLVRENDVAGMTASGTNVETLPLFLFESIDKLAETGKEKTIKDTIDGGGFIGLVILFLGAVALVLIFIRAVTLYKTAGKSSEKEIEDIAHMVENKNLEKAIDLSFKLKGAISRVLVSTLRGLGQDPSKIEDTIAESVLNEQPAINRFRVAISVFAAVAPLLGLLGTVTGMISTFDIITLHGTGDPKLLSGGISEALVTTELGLVVAIPTLLLGNLLSSWADSINSRVEISALKMVNAKNGFRVIKEVRA